MEQADRIKKLEERITELETENLLLQEKVGMRGKESPGMFSAQGGQYGTAADLFGKNGILQPQPKNAGKGIAQGGFIELGKEAFQQGSIVPLVYKADDAVEIEIRLLILLPGEEVWLPAIFPGGVPYDVHGPAFASRASVCSHSCLWFIQSVKS